MLQDFPLSQVYALLEPGPVVLLSTLRDGRANLMTLSWHMMMEFEPPLIGCILGEGNHSYAALRDSGQAVMAIPAAAMVETVVGIGNCSGRDHDKFAAFGLTPLPAHKVAPPLVGECFANLECRVVDDSMVDRYGLFVLEVVKAWAIAERPLPATLHHQGYGRFAVDGEIVTLESRMR